MTRACYTSCYCHTCDKKYHPLGIMRHRAKHREKKEDCVITYTTGTTVKHYYKPVEKIVVDNNN